MSVEGLSIPINGTEGAFHHGILTNDRDIVLVTHTHPGVTDSEDQRFTGDPIWHSHFVKLGDVEQCGEDQRVIEITWQSPGEVRINDDSASISNIPTDEFEGWNSITGEPLSIMLTGDVDDVISFKLEPVFGEEGLEAVCLTDIRSAEEEVNMD